MRAALICSLFFVALIAVPAGASAQAQPTDPEANSPSGAVYEIPVERARKDAAPRRASSPRDGDGAPGPTDGDSAGGDSAAGGSNASSGGGSTGGGSSAGDGTSIRSENNFGTSSQVPGADSGQGSGGRTTDGDDTGGGAGARNDDGPTSGATEEGGGAVEDFAQLAPSSAADGTDGPSDGTVFLLLAALVVVGAAIGVAAGRRNARDQRG
jgi:hypothetical protein